tara:strand:+ start:157 stop:2319 length:2163 start_codon:yes stop_codon:yes gene_type:complete
VKIKNKIYTLLNLLGFLFFSFENVFANVDNKDNITFILNTDDFETIPSKHLEFVEGFDQNTPFEKLFKLDWKKKLQNDQSFVDGYWVRFSVQNNTNKKNIGVTFNYNNEKKVFSLNNKTVTEYPYWNEKHDRWIDDGRVRASYKVIMNPNETTQVYSFFRKKPFDRYMGRDSLHRMTISSWENISTHQFVKIAANLATFAIAITFAIYYLFIFLVSKGNYLWLSLSLFQISFLSITNLVIGRIIGINSWFYASEFSLASISLLFLLLLQFFRQSLNLKVNYPVFNKIFVSTIIFYIVMIFLNLYTSLSWPSIMYLDLNLYPPDMNGPGLVKVKYLFAPFTFLLLTSAVISFLLWKKGSSYAKYLCISFALPFLSAPISGLAYLFYDFNWITWLIINSAVGILFLGMFITFGFAVAQQLNDMKLLALQQQVKLTEAYQRFVPQQLLKNLGKDSILDVSLGDQVNVEMSILFSDIRSFTSISEKMTPKENFSFLNSYLNQMSPIIRENKGYIDKFMGDGVMALFKSSANDSIKAAIGMQRYLKQYNSNSFKNKTHKINIGIGINTGEMMLGTLGDVNRMEGSVISDAVNLASRLEGLTKIYKVGIIISEETYNNINKDLFNTRFIDVVAVKGKDKPVKIFEIFDSDLAKLKHLKIDTLEDFKEAVSDYFQKNFKKALKLFLKINKINPYDKVTEIYINRCQKIIKGGMPLDLWDGINRLDQK